MNFTVVDGHNDRAAQRRAGYPCDALRVGPVAVTHHIWKILGSDDAARQRHRIDGRPVSLLTVTD